MKIKPFLINLLIAIPSGLFLLLTRGQNWLNHNQAQYFTYATALTDKDFIPKDWYTWQTFHHEIAFSYLMSLIIRTGHTHLFVLIAHLALLTLLSYSIILFCRRFCKYPLPVYFTLLTWIGIVHVDEGGLMGQYFTQGYFQPSEVSGCLMVIGLIFLLEHRFLFSGIVLEIAGAFHGSYMVSTFPVILATAWATGLWRNWKSLLSFAVPILICWGTFILVVLNALSHSSTETMPIMMYLRSQGELLVSQFPINNLVSWFVWAFLGLLAILSHSNKELKVCFIVLVATGILSLIQQLTINNPSITTLMLWRSASIALVFGITILLDCIITWHSELKKISLKHLFFVGILILSILYFYVNQWGPSSHRRYLWLIAIPASFAVAQLFGKNYKNIAKAFRVILISIMVAIMVRTSYQGIITSKDMSIPTEMEYWVQNNTPNNAVFLVPPEMEYMRIRGKRAVVVDFTATPYLPGDLKQWYKRLCDEAGVSGTPLITDVNVFVDGYNRMDTDRAHLLNSRYGANYVLVDAKHRGDLSGLTKTYSNNDYQIYKI